MSSLEPVVYPPAAPPRALPRVELMMSTLSTRPACSSVPLWRGGEGGKERGRVVGEEGVGSFCQQQSDG